MILVDIAKRTKNRTASLKTLELRTFGRAERDSLDFFIFLIYNNYKVLLNKCEKVKIK